MSNLLFGYMFLHKSLQLLCCKDEEVFRKIGMCIFFLMTDQYQREVTIGCVVTINTFVILFDLILYAPIFQLWRDGSSWVEPVLSKV